MTVVSVIQIEQSKRDLWDDEIGRFENAHPFNAFGWGMVRAIDGWKPTYLIAKSGSLVTGAIMMLRKPVPFTGFSIMYSPRGPVCDTADIETLKALLKRVCVEGSRRRAIFLRIDPNIPSEMFRDVDPFVAAGFTHLQTPWSFWNAPPHVYRVRLNHGKSEDDIFKLISPKARTGIRKSRKEKVAIRSAESVEDVLAFYQIFQHFADDKGFMARSYLYQEALWNEYISKGKGILFLAIYQDKIVGGEICLVFGQTCAEMHRAVYYKYHKLRVNEALVWEGIRWARERGCLWYSLRGAGPTPSHDDFKKKFASEMVSLAGYYDLVFLPKLYRIFVKSEFDMLPLIWPFLVKARRLCMNLTNRFKP